MFGTNTRAVVAVSLSFFFVGSCSTTFAELRDIIDKQIESGWQANSVKPVERSTDGEFLRRVYLDLVGRTPSYEQAVQFLDDKDPNKRTKLIDELLADIRFGQHQSDIWDMIYFGRNPPGYGTDKRKGFQDWLAGHFNKNTPYNQWTEDILRANGNTVENGAPMFYVQYKGRPEDATEAITQKFLGIQLQCARCHDHPFDDWTQKDFYGMAAFVARLRVVDIGTKNKEKAYSIGEMNAGDVLFTGPAIEQVPGKKGEPVKPKYLGAEALEEPALPEGIEDPRNFPNGKEPPKPHFSRKDAFAAWVTDPENPYFAKAVVNRVWGQFMGKGIVHPVDNLSPDNPASHPELLNALTDEFVAHNFDMKWLMREIVNSRAYQLSSAGGPAEAKPLWYERARYRPLSAEELLESWVVATGYNEMLLANGQKPEESRLSVKGVTWDYVRRFFGRPNDGVGDFQGGLHEHLYLNNGQVHSLISTRKGGLHFELLNSEEPWEKRVERLFVQVLSRRPTDTETKRFTEHLSAEADPRRQTSEAIWTLLTCSEFRFNN
jgi:hypothetical protein